MSLNICSVYPVWLRIAVYPVWLMVMDSAFTNIYYIYIRYCSNATLHSRAPNSRVEVLTHASKPYMYGELGNFTRKGFAHHERFSLFTRPSHVLTSRVTELVACSLDTSKHATRPYNLNVCCTRLG